jgi:hypothetical protein
LARRTDGSAQGSRQQPLSLNRADASICANDCGFLTGIFGYPQPGSGFMKPVAIEFSAD